MADSLRLVLLTPESQLVDEEVAQVTAPGALGEIGVLPDHAALVTTLDEGVVSYETSGGTKSVQIGGGFAEVRDNVMTVLATSGAVA